MASFCCTAVMSGSFAYLILFLKQATSKTDKSQTRLSDFDYFTKLNTLASDWFSEAKRIIFAV